MDSIPETQSNEKQIQSLSIFTAATFIRFENHPQESDVLNQALFPATQTHPTVLYLVLHY